MNNFIKCDKKEVGVKKYGIPGRKLEIYMYFNGGTGNAIKIFSHQLLPWVLKDKEN